jgi:putative peptidoglycan lipid II flippase
VKNRIAIASAIWGVALLLSRLIGLVRESVFAHTLGVSKAADVYQAAFRIPDWFSTLLAGGALSVVFIPIFSAHIERGDEARGWRTFSNMANLLLAIIAVVGTAFWVFAPALSKVLAPGFSPEQLVLLTRLTRIILPAQAFHMLGGLLSASLLARDRHLVPAVAPLLYSVGIIAFGLVGGTAEGFAWGVVAGAFVGPFLLPLVVTLRGGLRWSPVLDFSDPDLRLYLTRWVPVLLGGSLVLLDDTLLARFGSTLGEGAIATLGYAKTLMRAPMGIFGAAAGFAAYPALTRLALAGKVVDLYDLTTRATRRVLILAFLSQVGLTVAAPEIGTLVYGTARIAPSRMSELGICLSLFSLALGPWSAQIMLSRAFYAMGKGWVPARICLIVVAVCTPLYWLMAKHLGAPGLAAASSITVTISVCVLQAALRKQTGGAGGYGDLLGKALVVTAVAVAGALLVRSTLPPIAFSRLDALWRATVLCGVGSVLFIGLGVMVRLPELRESTAPLFRRMRR